MYVFIRFIFLVMWWTALGCANENDPWIGRYGIHLMWLNADLKVEDTLIFPDKKKENVVNALTGWIEKNPEETTNIFLWYDSVYVNQDALAKTEKEFGHYFSHFSQARLDRFRIQDIRKLDFVKEHPNLFTPVIPVYFQTDLLRFVIGKEAVSNIDSPIFCNTFLYADLNVTSENRDIVFDSTTIKFLNNYGIVLLRNDQGPGSHLSGGFFGFENKFMMLRLNADLNKAIEVGLIQLFLGYKEYIATELGDSLERLPIKHERYRRLQ